MSVVDQVGKIDLDPARDAALSRLEAARSVLKSSESREDARRTAQRAEFIELSTLEWFMDIVRIAEKHPETVEENAVYVAYALYRLGKLDELRALASKHASSAGVQLALAQLEYKTGNLTEARNTLLQTEPLTSPEDHADIAVNLSAIGALKGEIFTTESLTAFDASFNLSCYWLARGQPKRALEELHTALANAEEEDDRQSAIVQAGVAHLLLGEKDKAQQLFSQESLATSSPVLQLVLKNNVAVLTYDGSLASAHEALKAYDSLHQFELGLNADQRQILQRNELKLRARVGLPSKKRAELHASQYKSDFEPQVVNLTYTKSPKQIRKMDTVAAKLWIAEVDGVKFDQKPYLLFGPGDVGSLLPAAAQPEKHVDYWQSLDKEFAQAGLALSQGSADVDEASIDDLVKGIDANELEMRGTAPFQVNVRKDVTITKKRKRSGKKKLPADYDSNRTPNPERWLAKEDRSDYKPKRGKKNNQATQGAAVDAEVHTASSSQVVGGGKKKKKGRK